MTYISKIEQSKDRVYQHAIANKILTLMNGLRLNQKKDSSRRWIWELMQNAKDVADRENGVSIEINYEDMGKEGKLEFKHNGKPFSIDNLTFLIEQVSTKDRDPDEESESKTTGKFGTGFLTTHLLSEIVEVESVVKEPDEPYRKFHLSLDRSGRDIKTIINSVNKSLEALTTIDSQPKFDLYAPTESNTVFRYKLNESGIEVAKKGLKDLSTSLFFTLVFLPEIRSVTIINDGTHYKLSQTIIQAGEDIKIHTIKLDKQDEKSEIKIAVLTNSSTTIAMQIEDRDDQIYLKELDSLTPRLFCDFPLVGTEDFAFPVIINNPSFNPNEPRNGIYLTDVSDREIDVNKAIISDAVELYYILLAYASEHNWKNIYLLAKIPSIKEKEWFSKRWLESSVINPIKNRLLRIPIVDTEQHGRVAMLDTSNNPNVYFPSSPKEELRNKIWDLANLWIPSKLPRKADINMWYEIIWETSSKLSLEMITKYIQNKRCLGKLEEDLVEPADPVRWLNSYYDLINQDEASLGAIIKNQYAVIPNQNGIFKKVSELKLDEQIEEDLKNVLSLLGFEVRSYLLHNDVFTGESIEYSTKDQEEVINEINKILREGKNAKIDEACDYLVTLFSPDENFPSERGEIFEFCKVMYPETVNEKREIKKWSANIWLEADKKEFQRIIADIAETKNIEALTSLLEFSEPTQTLPWLDQLVSFLTKHDLDNFLNHKKKPILPNQNGEFRAKDDLFLDDGQIDETLKDISAELGHDFRNELLDVDIYLDLPQSRTKNQLDVAEEITRSITPKLSEIIRSNETKKLFRKLYLWFNEKQGEAAKYFDELYRSRHRLYDDEEIVANIQKAEELSGLMEEFGVSSVSDLRQILQGDRANRLIEQREQITQEILVSLGVSSVEELEEALKDEDIAEKFIHTSTPSVEMFRYAQGLISRAKSNILEHLKTLPGYDCSEMEELAVTVIGGIKKDGRMLHVVVRPSDNGEVIVYYRSEKDVLDYESAELWIDNGRETPSHLTLGKILKKTGINKIPV